MEINNLFGSLTSSECSLSLPELQQGPALTLKQNIPQLSQLVQGRKTVSLQFPFSDDPWINVSPSNHPLHQLCTNTQLASKVIKLLKNRAHSKSGGVAQGCMHVPANEGKALQAVIWALQINSSWLSGLQIQNL